MVRSRSLPLALLRAGAYAFVIVWSLLPIAFIVSLFNDSVGIYEVHNNGNWYNFGFVFGIALMSSIFSRPAFTAPARRRRRKS